MSGGEWFSAGLRPPISRSDFRSVVACAAYRTGSTMQDVSYGTVRDFSHKADVVTAFTVAPEAAPDWARDPEQLWNAVEAKENRKNSQLAFEWLAALPNELDDAQRENIARDFAGWLKDEYGVAVTVGIHNGGNRGNGLNDHMHVLMTTRPLDENGWAKNKLRDFNVRPGQSNPEVDRVREKIADIINEALEDAGSATRVDHRSFKERGIAREPTKHLGPAATAKERHGDGSRRGDINREIIEERLRWQLEQAQPEITRDIEREFAGRWGDQLTPEPSPARAGTLHPEPEPTTRDASEAEPEPPAREALTQEPTFDAPIGVHRRVTPWGSAWRAFADRARSFGSALHEVWDDETSGRPESERGLAARILDTGRELWGGIRGKNAAKLTQGVAHAVELAADHTEFSQRQESGKPPTWLERLHARAADILRNQRGAVPDLPDESGPDDPDAGANFDTPDEGGNAAPGGGTDHGPEPDEGPDIG